MKPCGEENLAVLGSLGGAYELNPVTTVGTSPATALSVNLGRHRTRDQGAPTPLAVSRFAGCMMVR